jgi:DNA end-binding protein Ku
MPRATSGSKSATRGKASAKPPRKASSATRPIWSGHLKLALVTVPVTLVSATTSGNRLSFHQVHAPTGKRIRYDKVVPGVGTVEPGDIRKGYEVSKGRYVLFKSEEIEDLKIEARRTLDLIQSVEHCEIDPIWFEKPYFVLPDGDVAEEPYAVIRDALKATKRVAIGQFVMRGRDYIAAIKPCGKGLLLETLRFPDEVKSASGVFDDIETAKPPRELLDLAAELIRRKAAPFDASAFEDRYEKALHALIEMRTKSSKVVDIDESKRPEGGAKVIDLVEALKQSVKAAEQPQRPPAKTPARRKAG